jgi:integrase/recombinase XerD
LSDNQVKAWAHYLSTEEGRSPATVREYLKDVRFLRGWLDKPEHPQSQRGRDWSEIGASDLRAFLAELSPAPRRHHRLVAAWRSFWRFLQAVQGLPGMQEGPMALKKPKLPKRLPMALTVQEVAKLLEVVYQDSSPKRGLRNWCIVAFLYGTGLRISEMLSLTFDRIEYYDDQPVVIRIIGKGDKERRLPLSETAKTALLRWLKERRTYGHPVSSWVWSALTGKRCGERMHDRSIRQMLEVAARRAGIDPAKASPHKLRHAFATALIERGRTLDEIKELLGHESIQTTTIYAHTSAKRVAAAAAALPDVVGIGR